MGLDSVELVMELESRFGITLPDTQCHRVRTVADLAALVVAHLPRTDGVCPTSRAFFDFRRLAVEHAGMERRLIRPKASLEDLFPGSSRWLWTRLRKHNRRLPRLVATSRVDTALLWLGGLLAFTWLMSSASLLGLHGAAVALPLSASAFALGFCAFLVITQKLQTRFPAGIATVGDVARAIAPLDVPCDSPGERLIAQQQILQEVRRITAEQLGLPLDSVQPSSDLVKDLGCD